MTYRVGAAHLLLAGLWCAVAHPEPVTDLACVRTGPTWALVQWTSAAMRHTVQVREGRRGPWRTCATVAAQSYCVEGLQAGRDYRIRVAPADDPSARPQWREVEVQTAPDQPLDIAGLRLWPPRPLTASPPTAMTWPALESYQGRLYVLEAYGCELWLSRVMPEDLKVLWRTRILPQLDESGVCYRAPDLCVHGQTLWISWEAHPTTSNAPPDPTRARFMNYDLSHDTDQAPGGQVSAPLELEPRVRGHGTASASIAVYQDELWVCWTECWQDKGADRAQVLTGLYEPTVGRVIDPIQWTDCPTAAPKHPSLARFGSDMVLLFTDASASVSGTETLMMARFDGGRIFDVATLRRLGRNRQARGVQLYDRFYYVYCTDAAFPAGAGQYFGVALGRMGAPGPGGMREALAAGLPLMNDSKLNVGPDVTAVGDELFVAFGKWEEPAVAEPRGWGTWITRVGWAGEDETESGPWGIEL